MTEKYFQVSGRSMEPALFDGDVIEIVSGEYQDGDIVVALAGDRTVVKRVVGECLVGDNQSVSATFKLADITVIGKAVKTLLSYPNAHLPKAEAATWNLIKTWTGVDASFSWLVLENGNVIKRGLDETESVNINHSDYFYKIVILKPTNWEYTSHLSITILSNYYPVVNLSANTEYGWPSEWSIPQNTEIYKMTGPGANPDQEYATVQLLRMPRNTNPTVTITSPFPNQSFSAVFPIVYQVSDADGDTVNVTEKLNGVVLRTVTNAPRDTDITTQIPQLNWDALAINTQHTFSITADDGNGGITTANLTFTKINAVPAITGVDGSLGDKNAPFTYTYQVTDADGDQVDVTEKLNSNVLRIIENAEQGIDYEVTISSENFYAIPINGTATIQIIAVDAIGNTSYRNVTFKRVNAAAVLTCATADALGTITDPPSLTVQVSDPEGDVITLTAALDGTIIQTVSPATPNSDITVAIPHATWIATTLGQHTLKVRATDSNGAYSERTFTFTRADDRVQFETAEAILTTAMATKIVPAINAIVPEGSALAVEVCNNGFDDEPTWEDATAKTLERKAYTFINDAKTAQDWGIKMRITLKKWTAEVASLEVAAAPTASGNVTVTLNGVDTTVAVDPATDTTTDAVATKIRDTVFADWITGGADATVTFTAATPGNKTNATYSPGATGATGTMTTVTQGTNPTIGECVVMGYGAAFE